MGDLSSTVLGFSTGTYSVSRPAASTHTKGRLDAPSASTLSVRACLQPLTGRDLQRLPEGMRTRELVALWSVDELLDKDVVTADGSDWEVQNVERWDQLGAYWRAVAVKVGR